MLYDFFIKKSPQKTPHPQQFSQSSAAWDGRLFQYQVSGCSRTVCLIPADITPKPKPYSKTSKVMSTESRQNVCEPSEHRYGKVRRPRLLTTG